jgi:hypothetical protein
MAGSYNFAIDQGADWTAVLTWKVNTVAVDLTNYTARMQLRPAHGALTTLLSLTTAVGGGITLGGNAGTVTLTLTAVITATLPPGDHVYDLELVSPAGVVTRLVEGRFSISPEVTR